MALPSVNFICNYNAKNNNGGSTIYQTDGQELYEDLSVSEGNFTYDDATGWYWCSGDINKVFDFYSSDSNPFSFYSARTKTFVFKVDGNASGPLFSVNTEIYGGNKEYVIYQDHINIGGQDFYYPDAMNGNITSIYVDVDNGILTIRSYYDDTGYNYSEFNKNFGFSNNFTSKAAFFIEDADDPYNNNFDGGFYWFYSTNNQLTDSDIADVINFNEYFTNSYLHIYAPIAGLQPGSGITLNEQPQIESSSDWQIYNYTDWVTFSPSSGTSGMTYITTTIAPNTGESRYTYIQVNNIENVDGEIFIWQESGTPVTTRDSDIFLGSTNLKKIYLGSNPVSKIYLGSSLIFKQATIVTALTLNNLTWVNNIPWNGGTATSANCTYTVTAYYSDGTSADVTSEASIAGSQVIPKSYEEGAHSAGTLTLTATYSGNTAQANVTIMQNSYNKRYHPLVFDIVSGGTIMWKVFNNTSSANVCTIQYKLNDGDWTAITATAAGVEIPVQTGDEIQFKGDNERYGNTSTSYPWVGSSFCGSTATFDLHGNIMALVNSDSTVYPALNTLSSAAFCRLFGNCNVRNADGLYLPTGLANYCYDRLFFGCSNLISVPELPATTLMPCCYRYMFGNCISLSYIKCLATDISATDCTTNWVYNIPSTGTFVKHPNATWSTGVNGIPSGWTVVNN